MTAGSGRAAIAEATPCGVTLPGALCGGTVPSRDPGSFVFMVGLDVDVLQYADGVFREDGG
jgi:hypothetical protein